MQPLIVAALVGGCSAYALWTLLPAAARRALAGALLRVPRLPQRAARRLQRVAQSAPGCGCDGCDAGAAARPAAGAAQPIVFRPRPRR